MYKAKRRKQAKIHAVEQNKFIEQAWKEAKQEVREHARLVRSIDKKSNIRLGRYKLVKSISNLAASNTYQEIPALTKEG